MKLIRRIDIKDAPRKIRFSHDGSQFWLNTRDEFVIARVYESEIIRIKPELFAFDMAYLDEEQIVIAGATAYRQHKLLIYDYRKQRIVSQTHTGDEVRSVCVDYNRHRIFAGINTGVFEYRVGIYSSSGHLQSKFAVRSLPFNMTLSISGDKLAIGSIFFEVWDVSSKPKLLNDYVLDKDCTGTPCEATCEDITSDGRYAVAGFHGGKGLCVVMDAETGNFIRWLGPEDDEFHYYDARSVAISPDGKYVAVASSNFNTVLVYRVSDGSILHKYPIFPCVAVAFSPRGDILALGNTNSVTLWSFEPD